jgi:deoxyribonuclease-4
MRIGAHVDRADPLAEGRERGADLVQFFLGDPQSWKKAVAPELGDAGDTHLYVHAPYVVNVASETTRSVSRPARSCSTTRASPRRSARGR